MMGWVWEEQDIDGAEDDFCQYVFLSLFPQFPLGVVRMMGCSGERLIMAAFPSLGKILDIPIYCTTQNAARLGATVSELASNFPPDTKEVDKTAFSMVRFPSASC